ncbi:MAG: hypothetical protein ABSH06_05390 [Thermodesulfobacteriota bacterium]|jgi:hypothetical protein
MGKKKRKGKRAYEKVVKIPNGVIEKIQEDLKNEGVKFYRTDEIPNNFKDKNLIHPDVLLKTTSVAVGMSACHEDRRNYMFLAPIRIDKESGKYVTDIDPIVMVADLDTGTPGMSGVVRLHDDFEGRTEEIKPEPLNVTLGELGRDVKGGTLSFQEAPERFKNAMHYMAKVYRKNLDKEPEK